MWFYLSPALYSVDQVKELTDRTTRSSATSSLLNPWTVLFTAYRDLIYYGQAPHWRPLGILLLVSDGAHDRGAIYYFKRAEPSFAKVL